MKLLIGIWMFLWVGAIGFSQPYKPLLDNYNEWHFTTCYFGCITDVYYTNGDTLVEGVPYKVLDGFHYISRTFLLREHVADRQVFLNKINTTGNTEYLLYDFSLQEGDSFEMFNPITPFPEQAGFFVVDSIRMQTLEDGEAYRHFYFSPSPSNTISDNNCIWIEGVGSLSLINAPSGTPDINEVGQLSCFFKNGNSFYTNLDSISACEPLLSVQDVARPLAEVWLLNGSQPNIFQLVHAGSVSNIEVYDLSGKKMFTHDNYGKEQVSLDFSFFPSGLYLLVVKDAQGRAKTLKAVVK